MRRAGSANQRYALPFRDYLRAHPATSAAYGELKRRRAAHLADPDRYPDIKDPAVDHGRREPAGNRAESDRCFPNPDTGHAPPDRERTSGSDCAVREE
ncbi:GrpB family protein [Chromobacterium sphagni]